MKNLIIALVAIAILGLVGWVAYDNTRPNTVSSPPGVASVPNQQPQANNAGTLDLSGKGLTKVGPEIYNRTDVTVLILSNNNLKTLPSEMGRMTRLETLKLDHNQLDGSLVAEVRKMPLKTLDVSYNNMTGVPAEIGQLHSLETLNYSHNRITGLPNELANLKDTLKEFNLTGNPLNQDINKLKASLPNTRIIF